MPKIKTIHSVVKRFKKNALGNFKCKHSNLRHLLTKKSTKRKRNLRKKFFTLKNKMSSISKCCPY